jgi:hypothetical protein
MAGDSPAAILFDAYGNEIGVSQDDFDGYYRLHMDGKMAQGSSGKVYLDAIDTSSGRGRLKTTLYSQEGEVIAFSSVASNPSSIKNQFTLNGSNSSLLVDGSITPVVFTYDADAYQDISLQELKLILVSNSITFGSDYFGSTAGPLTNGVLIEVISNNNTGTICNLDQNECFAGLATPGGFDWVVSSKDMVYSTYIVGGALKLLAGSSDKVRVTIRDNISSAGLFFKCFVKGNLLG